MAEAVNGLVAAAAVVAVVVIQPYILVVSILFSIIPIWGLPKIRGTFLGVPILRTLVFGALYCGPRILGNYYITPTYYTKP